MRIKPPGQSPTPTGAAGPATSAGAPTEARPANPAAPTAAARDIGPAGTVSPALIAEVAAQLKGGTLTPKEAVDRLIDELVSRHAAAGPRRKLAAELRELLRHHVEIDPYLAARVRRFGEP